MNEAYHRDPDITALVREGWPWSRGPRWSLVETGRVAFGLSMVGFGLVSSSQMDFLISLQPVPEWVPGYSVLAVLNGLVLGASGLAMIVSKGERVGALAVGILFSCCIVLLHLPSAFTQPSLLRSPWWIRTFESGALLAGAMTLAGLRSTPARPRWIRGSRIAFGVSIPVFGVLHLLYASNVASLVPHWYPWPLFSAYATGIAQIVGGLAIASNVWSRQAAILAGVMYGAWTLTLHAPRVWCRSVSPCPSFDLSAVDQPTVAELASLFVALGMTGAAWLVAGGIAAAGGPPRAAPAPEGASDVEPSRATRAE